MVDAIREREVILLLNAFLAIISRLICVESGLWRGNLFVPLGSLVAMDVNIFLLAPVAFRCLLK